MVAKLHSRLKQFYPVRDICNIIEGHFAKLDQIDRKVSGNGVNGAALQDIAKANKAAVGDIAREHSAILQNIASANGAALHEIATVNGAALQDIAANDAALLQAVTFLVQQAQQQQAIYQQLEQKRERDNAASCQTASLVESLNALLRVWAAQNRERGTQLTAALEHLAKSFREPIGRRAEFLTAVEALDQRCTQVESRTLQKVDCLREQTVETAEAIRESDRRRADEFAQIIERLAGLPTQQRSAELAGTIREFDRRRADEFAQILERLTGLPTQQLSAELAEAVRESDLRRADEFAQIIERLAGLPMQQLSAELAESVRESDRRRADEFAQIIERLAGLPTQQPSAELAEMVRESDRRRADEFAQIIERLAALPAHQASPPPVPVASGDQSTIQSGLHSAIITIKGQYFELENPEITLIVHLAPLLGNRNAIDIGANVGEASGRLLAGGYEVFAFEPFPPIFAQLKGSFGDDEHFHAHQFAVGYDDRTMELHIAEEISPTPKYGDSVSLYHSLLPHSMPCDLQFTRKLNVRVRSVDSLVRANLVPAEVGAVKIDTEGYDLEVIRGMGACSTEILMAEFWDPKMIFGRSGAMNRLSDLTGELRPRGYRWHIVFYRSDNRPISYYCNQDQSVAESWGNVIYFKDKQLFEEARQWCAAVLPPTYFTA